MADSRRRLFGAVLLCWVFYLIGFSQARETKYITGTDAQGITRQLAVDRYPALYTGDFGDCLGGQSLFNITKLDAAYYTDNSSVIFHLDGTSNLRNESLMVVITLEAYGEERYSQTIDPCTAIFMRDTMCPLNASKPISAYAGFIIGPQQVGSIPSIAFDIPDFEGSIKFQIFANSSQTEIGCFQAVMTNGNTFSHPEAVGPVLGVFLLVGIIASLATAIYGVSIPHMRTHYAHSISVLVMFETLQAIFFSGALSVNWPSVLPAFWSNFAWSAGIIRSSSMVNSLDGFAGISGNASQAGGAGSSVINSGGGMARKIYGRSLQTGEAVGHLMKRKTFNESDPYDYKWGGDPVSPGMPAPGTWTGFPATLSMAGVPSGDAFLISLIWFLVLLGLVIISVLALKGSLEMLARFKRIKEDRLAYFRSHYWNYTLLAVLRTFFIAFSAMTTFAIFQFAIHGSTGATAIAAIVFILFLAGVGGIAWYACHFRLRFGNFSIRPDTVVFHQTRIVKVIPCLLPTRTSTLTARGLTPRANASLPFFRIHYDDQDPNRATVHKDQAYVKRFGWLSARYRRTRWWFFVYYLAYQLIRAAFIGGAGASPLAQVYGLLVVEIVAFVVIAKLDPFEGSRNTALAVWMLSISKVVTTGLSIAFLPAFNLNRIIATVLGVIIIVVQGFLVIAMMILIVLGAISSWMSLTRNREEFEPEWLDGLRLRYFENLDKKAADLPTPASEKKDKKGKGKEKDGSDEPEVPKEPYFSVNTVRRAPKIEDEKEPLDELAEMAAIASQSGAREYYRPTNRRSRAYSAGSRYSVNSVTSTNSVTTLPKSGRQHRASWSSKDIAEWDASVTKSEINNPTRSRRVSSSSLNHAYKDSDRSSTPLIGRPGSGTNGRRSITPLPPSSLRNSMTPGSPTKEIPEEEEGEDSEVSPITDIPEEKLDEEKTDRPLAP
ncbi:uncharacterized protein E0L32_005420 [Thyridium curvatum]|uniref:ML-like domain-containing protein n=1 Tax=Thyridium curvatum TaxID=1093900 RepID=A0A507B5T1_9PEZI|nr:uncharacterized protein E0L32_005420 [Thyridium curvatum]TPX14456.1 hypothetical protein E0L32_005420 [Thyridium curvatum]